MGIGRVSSSQSASNWLSNPIGLGVVAAKPVVHEPVVVEKQQSVVHQPHITTAETPVVVPPYQQAADIATITASVNHDNAIAPTMTEAEVQAVDRANKEEITRRSNIYDHTLAKDIKPTVLNDKDYIGSLNIIGKVDKNGGFDRDKAITRYNMLHGKAAFHSMNPEIKAIRKRLGIDGKGNRLEDNKAKREQIKAIAPDMVNAADIVNQMAYGNTQNMPGYTPIEVAAQNAARDDKIQGMIANSLAHPTSQY